MSVYGEVKVRLISFSRRSSHNQLGGGVAEKSYTPTSSLFILSTASKRTYMAM